ncbi:MAG: hypothetical protein KAR21_07315, partial [Spirochaetales bacterium]|nr:hypothetical protein [Spirochaetales bacterium]
DNFESAQLIGEANTKNEYFIDYPSTTEKYYYAVLALDSAGKTYNLFIPYKNVTSIPVGVVSLTSPEKLAVIISDIKTITNGNAIEISFNSSESNRDLIIYRSTSPILKYQNLIKASLIATIPSSNGKYTDHPIPGIPYYYAVMDSELTKSGRYVFNTGENITEYSALVRSGVSSMVLESRETLRNQPLPYLKLTSSIDTGKILSQNSPELPAKYNLSFESTTAVNNILMNFYTEGKKDLKPVILAEDIDISENSEEYQLKRILESDFKEQNWIIAYKLISNLLSVHHSEHIDQRAHFYRAQILYFQNRYRESFMEFVLVGKDMEKETEPWLNELLTIL